MGEGDQGAGAARTRLVGSEGDCWRAGVVAGPYRWPGGKSGFVCVSMGLQPCSLGSAVQPGVLCGAGKVTGGVRQGRPAHHAAAAAQRPAGPGFRPRCTVSTPSGASPRRFTFTTGCIHWCTQVCRCTWHAAPARPARRLPRPPAVGQNAAQQRPEQLGCYPSQPSQPSRLLPNMELLSCLTGT